MNGPAEEALVMNCAGARMVGVLHRARELRSRHGVLVVVGGPQYRVGSHRQFLLMAREFAREGYPVLRFDYRGMGDSEGEFRGFEQIAEDLQTAIDAFLAAEPAIEGVVLWGLCDGGSAALMYAASDSRVAGLVIVNGWAHTVAGEAKALVDHYYGARLLQVSFWKKLLGGQVHVLRSLREFLATVRASRNDAGSDRRARGFIDRMRAGFEAFTQPVLLLESGRDLTAAEFATLRASDAAWSGAERRSNVTLIRMPDADHTFSRRSDLDSALRHCVSWLRTVAPGRRQTERSPCR